MRPAAALHLALAVGAVTAEAQETRHTIQVGALTREYLLFMPQGATREAPVPLVLVFHGGTGNAAQMARMTRFTRLAERERFAVAYPQGIGENWNDGRIIPASEAHARNIDDKGFIAALLDLLAATRPIDPKRVYATGISNGAFFSHYLAANLAHRIAAIAPVVGGIADPFHQRFSPSEPVSVFILQGTADPLVPYDGGAVARNRGRTIATDEALRLWRTVDDTGPVPETGVLEDLDKGDGCRVEWSRWTEGRHGTEVQLYKLIGGGHTWPGGPQYLPKFVVGPVCRDLDATRVIWDFFARHRKPE